MARLVDEAGRGLGRRPCVALHRRDRPPLAGAFAGADYPRHPATDPREPDPGKGRQGWEGQMIVHQPRRHRRSESAGVLVASRPDPRTATAALTRPAPSRLLALADAVLV